MPKEYTTEQLWKLYRKIPEELQEAIFSVETADSIYDVCEKNEIQEISRIAKFVGYVLLGILPPEELEESLKEELVLSSETAKKISREINRFIFYPLKRDLADLYKAEGVPPEIEPRRTPLPKKKKTPKKDVYREQIKEE